MRDRKGRVEDEVRTRMGGEELTTHPEWGRRASDPEPRTTPLH